MILAFETSCDDTCVALLKDKTEVVFAERVAQPVHNAYGGVVPEIAAREHATHWKSALEKLFKTHDISKENIDFLAVTHAPGLQNSLLTGTVVAQFLGLLWDKPVCPVHHIFGHISSIFLDRKPEEILYPNICFTVSGGHTQVFLAESATQVTMLGTTLDDAAGEAFDKCAKMLGLGYPGGPIVSKKALKGDRNAFDFPRIFLGKESFDFSFSGLKGAVFRKIAEHGFTEKAKTPFANQSKKDQQFIHNVCASFEQTVADIFVLKLKRAIKKYPEIQQIHLVGGVSANNFLVQKMKTFAHKNELEFLTPKHQKYSTDNAEMIGSAASILYENFGKKVFATSFFNPQPRMKLEDFLSEVSVKK